MSDLIIGASSGLGREIAYEFARNSKNLILISRNLKDLEILKSDLNENCYNTPLKASCNNI